MGKAKQALSLLARVSQNLDAIEAFGIPIDRLIGISNAQGPIAEIIRGILLLDASEDQEVIERIRASMPPKGRRRKALKPSS
jgi:hypothetical protein